MFASRGTQPKRRKPRVLATCFGCSCFSAAVGFPQIHGQRGTRHWAPTGRLRLTETFPLRVSFPPLSQSAQMPRCQCASPSAPLRRPPLPSPALLSLPSSLPSPHPPVTSAHAFKRCRMCNPLHFPFSLSLVSTGIPVLPANNTIYGFSCRKGLPGYPEITQHYHTSLNLNFIVVNLTLVLLIN